MSEHSLHPSPAAAAPAPAASASPATGSMAGQRGHASRQLLPSVVWLVALVVVVLVVILAVRQAALFGVPITVSVDGAEEVVRTSRDDVGGLLVDLGLALRAEDRLSPAPDTPLSPVLQVTIERAHRGLVSSDGRLSEVFTLEKTVGGLLSDGGIIVTQQDEVLLDGEPVALDAVLRPASPERAVHGLPAGRKWDGPAPAPVHLTIHRAVSITVDDGSVPYTLFTTAATVGDALLRESVTLYLGDRVRPSLGSRINPGMRVFIQRSKPVIVSADGHTVQTRTRGETVGAALMDLGIIVTGMDEVTPALHEALVDHMRVKVVRVSEVTLVQSEPIPFESISVPDDKLEIDHQRLVQAGVNGEYRKRWKVRYEDGAEVSRDLVDEWEAAAPVTRMMAYGRMLVPRTLDTPEGPVTYWRKIRMYATSYSPARAGTPKTAPWYGRTRIGMTLRKGLVAIDPKVIPFHTPLYIPGYGKGLAADTGGGVRGKWIDLGYEDHDYESWHWWVDVYVLEPRSAPEKITWVLPNYPPASFPRVR